VKEDGNEEFTPNGFLNIFLLGFAKFSWFKFKIAGVTRWGNVRRSYMVMMSYFMIGLRKVFSACVTVRRLIMVLLLFFGEWLHG
jgi:hypothetical protein